MPNLSVDLQCYCPLIVNGRLCLQKYVSSYMMTNIYSTNLFLLQGATNFLFISSFVSVLLNPSGDTQFYHGHVFVPCKRGLFWHT